MREISNDSFHVKTIRPRNTFPISKKGYNVDITR